MAKVRFSKKNQTQKGRFSKEFKAQNGRFSKSGMLALVIWRDFVWLFGGFEAVPALCKNT